MKTALDKARDAPGSTKARILSAAEAIFASRGFEGASTREIASRAGVNISSLHYHWESKETLYLAVLRNIYDQVLELLQTSVAPMLGQHQEPERMIDHAMRQIFDFFAGNPNVPKLLMRRIVDQNGIDTAAEREVLEPVWTAFSQWLGRLDRAQEGEHEARLFMLAMHSALLVFLIDSPSYQHILGGSVRDEPLRQQVRDFMVALVRRSLA